ncbi:MAG: tripartite tricarboxylate transporter permease [Betaproteobacteria bacterium]
MEALAGLMGGFAVLAEPANLAALAAGCVFGSLVGVLPGVGPVGAMAILLPLSFTLEPSTAVILLAGIFYGAQYGGSTTAILLNIPGEATSVVTALDGYQLTRRGRAGPALFVAAVGSFVAGTLAVAVLMFVAPLLADAAVKFGPPEFFAITAFGLMLLARLTGGSLPLVAMLVAIGLALTTVGLDQTFGKSRFTFGVVELFNGLELVAVAVGLFGIAEVLSALERRVEAARPARLRLRELLPSGEEARRSAGPMLRGAVVGFPFGLVPGPAVILSTFASYGLERRLSKRPQEFGSGAIEGVAGPESANNSAAVGALVPLLSLGVPFAPPTAILLGAFVLHGIQPGPLLAVEHPEVFWGLIASMYAGNVMLLALNLPLIGLFVWLLRIPRDVLLALVVVLSFVGVYSVNNSTVDLYVMTAMGALGWGLRKFGLSPATLILPFVIGALMEKSLVQTLILARGDPGYLLTRPIALVLLALGIAALLGPALLSRRGGSRRLAQ